MNFLAELAVFLVPWSEFSENLMTRRSPFDSLCIDIHSTGRVTDRRLCNNLLWPNGHGKRRQPSSARGRRIVQLPRREEASCPCSRPCPPRRTTCISPCWGERCPGWARQQRGPKRPACWSAGRRYASPGSSRPPAGRWSTASPARTCVERYVYLWNHEPKK